MNLEELDGFFAALIAGPEMVMPSEYYPHVFGGTMEETCEFDSLDQANAILGLLSRHWNTIAGTLYADEVHLPLLLEDDKGVAPANDWARGFMRGVELRREAWADLINSDEHGGSILPMMMLYHEHDPDPEMRPNPIGAGTAGGHHRPHGGGSVADLPLLPEPAPVLDPASHIARTVRRDTAKVGRNDPCPCGSGKKYKHCHGGTTLH